ncbi:MAG TPA: sigma 54-interacting transcriptional regulator [Kofleriaceae bacterium]
MRIALLTDYAPDPRIRGALMQRGHAIAEARAADLVIADAELAARDDLVATIAGESPGTEFILLGAARGEAHPDVIEQLGRPVDLDRLLRAVDELADVLDGERRRQPTDLVAYDTVFGGASSQIRDLLRRVRIVARSEAPVWIVGDDGSGRAVVARAIHDRSSRRACPFVAFSTVAYPDDELARRLFAGTDAAVRAAQAGTLFVERIGSAGPITQRELAHYLETAPRDDASPRLVFGIQRDLALDGAPPFVSRELYYGLKVLEVEIPALATRGRDLDVIVARMLARLAAAGDAPSVSPRAMELLAHYSFPGNLLELAHALTHAYILARTGAIEPEHLPLSIRANTRAAQDSPAAENELEALDVVAKRFERDYLLRVLRSVAGNRGRAAEILGITRKGLWGKLKAHGISDQDLA